MDIHFSSILIQTNADEKIIPCRLEMLGHANKKQEHVQKKTRSGMAPLGIQYHTSNRYCYILRHYVIRLM